MTNRIYEEIVRGYSNEQVVKGLRECLRARQEINPALIQALADRLERLDALLNTPLYDDFLEAVKRERRIRSTGGERRMIGPRSRRTGSG